MSSITVRPDTGRIKIDDSSYVIPTRVKRGHWSQEPTPDDERYLTLFEKCFQAATSGNINRCENVVAEGFADFNAVGYGPSFEGKSPFQIAEEKGHQDIVSFFKKVMSHRQISLEILRSDQIYDHLVRRINAGASDEELSFLVDKIEEPLYENPLDTLLEIKAPKSELTVQKLARIFPVTRTHIENALAKQYSSITVLTLLEAAVEQNKRFNAESCLFWLFLRESPYSEETARKFVSHARNVDMHYLKAALELGFSNATLEALIEKVQVLDYEIAPLLFPRTVVDFFEHHASNTDLTQESLASYWNRFKNTPKPYLIYPIQHPDTFIKKVLDRLPFALSYLVGTVSEDIICYFLENYADYQVDQFELEHALLCGYSESLILELIKRLGPSATKNQAKEIAEIKGYSDQVLQNLYDPFLPCSII